MLKLVRDKIHACSSEPYALVMQQLLEEDPDVRTTSRKNKSNHIEL
jgi:hypothetical protein